MASYIIARLRMCECLLPPCTWQALPSDTPKPRFTNPQPGNVLRLAPRPLGTRKNKHGTPNERPRTCGQDSEGNFPPFGAWFSNDASGSVAKTIAHAQVSSTLQGRCAQGEELYKFEVVRRSVQKPCHSHFLNLAMRMLRRQWVNANPIRVKLTLCEFQPQRQPQG